MDFQIVSRSTFVSLHLGFIFPKLFIKNLLYKTVSSLTIAAKRVHISRITSPFTQSGFFVACRFVQTVTTAVDCAVFTICSVLTLFSLKKMLLYFIIRKYLLSVYVFIFEVTSTNVNEKGSNCKITFVWIHLQYTCKIYVLTLSMHNKCNFFYQCHMMNLSIQQNSLHRMCQSRDCTCCCLCSDQDIVERSPYRTIHHRILLFTKMKA